MAKILDDADKIYGSYGETRFQQRDLKTLEKLNPEILETLIKRAMGRLVPGTDNAVAILEDVVLSVDDPPIAMRNLERVLNCIPYALRDEDRTKGALCLLEKYMEGKRELLVRNLTEKGEKSPLFNILQVLGYPYSFNGAAASGSAANGPITQYTAQQVVQRLGKAIRYMKQKTVEAEHRKPQY